MVSSLEGRAGRMGTTPAFPVTGEITGEVAGGGGVVGGCAPRGGLNGILGEGVPVRGLV